MSAKPPEPCEGCGCPFVIGSWSHLCHLPFYPNTLLGKTAATEEITTHLESPPLYQIELDDLSNPILERNNLKARNMVAC